MLVVCPVDQPDLIGCEVNELFVIGHLLEICINSINIFGSCDLRSAAMVLDVKHTLVVEKRTDTLDSMLMFHPVSLTKLENMQ